MEAKQNIESCPWTTGLFVGLLSATIEIAVVALCYGDLGPLRSWPFFVFYGLVLAAGWALFLGLSGAIVKTLTGASVAPGRAAAVLAASMLSLIAVRFVMSGYPFSDTFSIGFLGSVAILLGGVGVVIVGAVTYVDRMWHCRPVAARAGWLLLLSVIIILFCFRPGVRDVAASAPNTNMRPQRELQTPLSGIYSNLLLVTIDTLRADHLEAYGYAHQTAPTIAALAANGSRVQRTVTQRTFTSPSLASILTGTYPPTHGVLNNGDKLQDFNLTLAELLAARGYRTQALLSIPGLMVKYRFGQGFHEYQRTREHEQLLKSELEESRYLNQHVRVALEKLAVSDTPFFLWLHYRDPHAPYVVPESYKHLFTQGARSAEEADGNRLPSFDATQYDAEIRFNDDSLRDVLTTLTQLGLAGKTLIIVTADHGESLGEHDYYSHGLNAYEPSLSVPLVLHHPALPAGRVIDGTWSLVDILPTVLDLLGFTVPDAVQGESFAPRIVGEAVDRSPYHYFIAASTPGYLTHGVTTSTHKLILSVDERWRFVDWPLEMVARLWRRSRWTHPYFCRRLVWELYDLKQDPHEVRNMTGLMPDVEARLEQALWAWMDTAYAQGRRAHARSNQKKNNHPVISIK